MADFTPYAFDPTAFMSGQIGSKVWLCEELEPVLNARFDREVRLWLLGGWYGMIPFLLSARQQARIGHSTSFDIDPEVARGASVLNENLIWQNRFTAVTQDVNAISYEVDFPPDCLINTSSEHIMSKDWYEAIPAGMLCCFQSNDMDHDDHVHKCHNGEDLAEQFKLTETLYLGEKSFDYPDWSFTRYMHIGIK